MKTEEFFDAMNDLPDEWVLDAGKAREKAVPRRRRILRTALLAAARAEFEERSAEGYVCPIEPDAVPIAL